HSLPSLLSSIINIFKVKNTFFLRKIPPIPLSPYLPIPLSPYLPIPLSPYLPISLSPYLPISLSPYLPISPNC
ncbi:hypothetical protein, partial [Moorena sp. SIO3I8]|uniref:hypothetical protein n=1 Tax=Moorena sp. SIO3I8 TaxID=2607833 RepID=UPI0013BF4151